MLCAARLNTAVRVEFMARYVPSQAGNVTHDLFVTLLYRCHLSIASRFSVLFSHFHFFPFYIHVTTIHIRYM
jgi:hypothetical protein